MPERFGHIFFLSYGRVQPPIHHYNENSVLIAETGCEAGLSNPMTIRVIFKRAMLFAILR